MSDDRVVIRIRDGIAIIEEAPIGLPITIIYEEEEEDDDE